MVPDNSWLKEEWYELHDDLHRFKEMLKKRAIAVIEKGNLNGAIIKTTPQYRIYIKRNASDAKKLFYLIHEFTHFELGHRETRNCAVNEVEACFVSYIVGVIFHLKEKPENYIYEHAYWLPGIYKKAYGIAAQLREHVFTIGALPANHDELLSHSMMLQQQEL